VSNVAPFPKAPILRSRAWFVRLLPLVWLLVSCAAIQDGTGRSVEITRETYTARGSTQGVVLLAVKWGRRWNCGGFENAELRSLEFHRLPVATSRVEPVANLTLEGPGRLVAPAAFVNYAVLLDPGEYALSGFRIKVAKAMTDVGYLTARPHELLKGGTPQAGTFIVGPGETVYIGNFFLDCQQGPTLWRYYTEGRRNFQLHLAEFKQQYPYLDVERTIYRLFKTDLLGRDYDLP
jgi:hypothetical protein